MKGKSLTFRPSYLHRLRLERLAAATGHKITFHVEACIAAQIPELEKRYARELSELAKKTDATKFAPSELNEKFESMRGARKGSRP